MSTTNRTLRTTHGLVPQCDFLCPFARTLYFLLLFHSLNCRRQGREQNAQPDFDVRVRQQGRCDIENKKHHFMRMDLTLTCSHLFNHNSTSNSTIYQIHEKNKIQTVNEFNVIYNNVEAWSSAAIFLEMRNQTFVKSINFIIDPKRSTNNLVWFRNELELICMPLRRRIHRRRLE